MSKPAESRLCSTREYANLRGISRQRVLALLDAGRITGASWIGSRWAIPRSARVAPPARAHPTRSGLAQLTPLENALLGEFVERVRSLRGARLERVVVFGSRARGVSRADSDLDVAVFLAGNEDRALRAAVYAAAASAAAALEGGDLALLQPSVIFAASPRTGFVDIVEREGLTWTS
jgi:predicted nucleotidyltransferase